MSDINYYEALKVGALLHDIGKWYKLVNKDIKGHHDDYGVRFINYCEKTLKIFKIYGINEKELEIIKFLIKNHHKDDIEDLEIDMDKEIVKHLLNILKISDILSNGELIKPIDEKTTTSKYIHLASIFENIHQNWENRTLKNYYDCKKYNLRPLAINKDTIFPKDIETPKGKSNDEIIEYVEKYVKNNENLKIDKNDENFDNFEKLLLFVQKYTWCVPSTYSRVKDTKRIPDVSLYDHLKTTCAIACCLYKQYPENGKEIEGILKELNEITKEIKKIHDEYERKMKNCKNDEKKKLEKELKEKIWNEVTQKYLKKSLGNVEFSLIHGDISGIQDFVFNIVSKGAAKSLKGRSFYLDFLTELCARYIAKELGLPIANILFYGGGHFYILSYKVSGEKLDDFEKEINKILFDKFGIDLYVAIGKVDLRPIDFLIDCMYESENEKVGIPYKWRKCAEETSKKKMKKFYHMWEKLFTPQGYGDENKKCQICKKEANKLIRYNTIDICEECASFIDITNFLKKFGKEEKIDYNHEIECISVNDSVNEDNIEEKHKECKFKNLSVFREFFGLLYKLDDNELSEYYLPDENGDLAIPYKIWSIAFPSDGERIKDFDELAEQAKNRTGTNKIAVLKMDVDNLGKIITRGLGDYATISRLSTLSSMLTLFFTGYIPYLIKTGEAETVFEENGERAKYKDNIYLVYSGGDDTLIVGAWDAVWDLAKRIRKDFEEFVCHNPDITLSAGIVIVNPKFEFKKAVELADDELETGKSYTIVEDFIEKNALTIFNCPMNWNLEVIYSDSFWEKLMEKYNHSEKFKKLIDENKMKKLKELSNEFNEDELERKFYEVVENTKKRRILHISQIVADRLSRIIQNSDEGLILNLPYYWRLLYYIHRNYGDDIKYVKFLEDYAKKKIINSLFTSQIKLDYNDLKVSAKIVELKTRK